MKQDHIFKKKFGQNFLKYQKDSQFVVDALDIKENESIIEIGPGDGRLSKLILEKNANLTAIEIDTDLVSFLTEEFKENENFNIINSNILDVNLDEIFGNNRNYKIIGSLPYNISKQIINKILKTTSKPFQMVLMIQKEVAEDYAATPPNTALIGHLANVYYDIKLIKKIKNSSFHPKPKVDGGVLLFKLKSAPLLKDESFEDFAKFLKAAYSSPRKMLMNNLNKNIKNTNWHEIFDHNKIDPKTRASQLDTLAFIKLFNRFMISQ